MNLTPQFLPRTGPLYLWEALRRLRNDSRGGFTHTTTEVTPEMQHVYRMTYSENVRHYLYWTKDRELVGFSRLEWRDDGYVYPTYAVAPNHRGHGYAWDIVKHAMLAAGGPLRGDLLLSNKAIMRVDFGLGWRPSGPPVDGVLPVEAEWPPAFANTGYTRDAHHFQQQDVYDEIIRYMEGGA